MNYYRFFLHNRKILIFAILLTFYSGFGQTFLLSLYIPEIISEFGISQSVFSSIYAIATLCSGFTIIFAGKLIDRMPLMKFTLLVVAGIIAANLVAGFAFNLVLLFLGFFMLRFFGQGLLSHTSMTTMGRYFTYARGKALSIAYLGFPLAEALFPITIVSLIGMIGWRESLGASAVFIAITLIPLAWYLLSSTNKSMVVETPSARVSGKQAQSEVPERSWRQKEIIANINFYIFAPTVFIVGFTLTALFFFQTFIAEFKGWTVEWMALSIAAYAISSFFFSIVSGPLIDRFTARRIFPFVLLPLAAGLLILILFDHPVAAVFFWLMTGITAGANPTTGNALYAETYGVKSLGSIRSIFTFVMVASTAAGPVVYSFLIKMGFTYNHIHLILIGVILANILFILGAYARQSGRQGI
ncbi:MAG: MFS transporter [Bacteroidota bacterium]